MILRICKKAQTAAFLCIINSSHGHGEQLHFGESWRLGGPGKGIQGALCRKEGRTTWEHHTTTMTQTAITMHFNSPEAEGSVCRAHLSDVRGTLKDVRGEGAVFQVWDVICMNGGALIPLQDDTRAALLSRRTPGKHDHGPAQSLKGKQAPTSGASGLEPSPRELQRTGNVH